MAIQSKALIHRADQRSLFRNLWEIGKRFIVNVYNDSFVGVRGISDETIYQYAKISAWAAFWINAPTLFFALYAAKRFIPEEDLVGSIVFEHIVLFMPVLGLSVYLTYKLPIKKLHLYVLVQVFAFIISLIYLSSLGGGKLMLSFLPIYSGVALIGTSLLYIYPVQALIYLLFFWCVVCITRYEILGSVPEIENAWISFNLLYVVGGVFNFILRKLFNTMGSLVLQKEAQIDELIETNALLNITLNENHFGLVGYDATGRLALERGASLQRVMGKPNISIDYSKFSNLKNFIENETNESFGKLLKQFVEVNHGSSHFVMRAYRLKNLIIFTHMDVTQIRKIEAELRARQKLSLIGEITSGVAHNYNNTLSIALSNLEAIPQKGNERIWQGSIMPCIDAIEKSTDITRKLLALAGQQNLAMEVFDPSATIREMKSLIVSVLGSEIELVIDADMPLNIFTDPHEFESAILNMVINSRNAVHPHRGKIEISTYQKNNKAVVAIKDNGHGIDPSIQEKVFDPFFSTKPTSSSTGLGLSTVKGFVEQSMGSISLSSNKSGTCFELHFPLSAKAKNANTKPLTKPVKSKTTHPEECVLIVDDNPQVVKSCETLLNFLGFNTMSSLLPSKSLEILKRNPQITHALLDLSMPEMDGIMLGEKMKAIRPDLTLFLITGDTSSPKIGEAKSVGFREILIKPVRAKTFSELLNNSSPQKAKKSDQKENENPQQYELT